MFNSFLFNGGMFNGSAQGGGATGEPMSIYYLTYALPSNGLTKVGIKLKNIVVGDDKGFDFTFTNLLPGTAIERAWFTGKKKEKDADADALFQKQVTTSSLPIGQIIEASTADGRLRMRFNLNADETEPAKIAHDYYFDVQVMTSTGRIHTLVVGTMGFIRGYTAATA
jgi:hypothetical protein